MADLIASGYEFTCEICDAYNKLTSTAEVGICGACGHENTLDIPEHCYGSGSETGKVGVYEAFRLWRENVVRDNFFSDKWLRETDDDINPEPRLQELDTLIERLRSHDNNKA